MTLSIDQVPAMMRSLADGGHEIRKVAALGNDSYTIGLYLPNSKTFWITGYTHDSNDPNWNSVFYHVSDTWEDRPPQLENRDELFYSPFWNHAGNSHGAVSKYTHAWMLESGFDDGYFNK